MNRAIAAATFLTAAAAVASTVVSLGGGRGFVALIAAGAAALVGSAVALWAVGSRSIRRYRREALQARKRAVEEVGADLSLAFDHEDLQTQIVPSFADARPGRMRDFFENLVDRLELSDTEAAVEKSYISKITEDKALSREEKAETLVDHFAERSLRPPSHRTVP